MKTFLKFSVFVLAMVLFLACEKVTEISLNKNELYLVPGETETLIATVYPTGAYHKKANWISSNPAVATVTDNGLVTAIESGETIITASSQNGEKTAICFITVDYRAKWVGAYECEKRYGAGYVEYVAVDVLVKEDSLLYIVEKNLDPERAGVESYMKIDMDGSFQNVDIRPPFIFGDFYEDSLHIFYFYPTPGAGISISYDGKKQK